MQHGDWLSLATIVLTVLGCTAHLSHRFGRLESRVELAEQTLVDTQDRVRTHEVDIATLKGRVAA